MSEQLAQLEKKGGAENITHSFFLGPFTTGQSTYGGLFIPVSEIGNKTKVKLTIVSATNAKAYNNNVYLSPLSSSFVAGPTTTATGQVGNFVNIPSLSGYEYLRVSVAGLLNSSGSGNLYCTVELA